MTNVTTRPTPIAVAEPQPLLVDAVRAARMLCIGRTALYHLIWSGELEPIHIGRSVRFAVEDLEDFVRSRRSTGD